MTHLRFIGPLLLSLWWAALVPSCNSSGNDREIKEGAVPIRDINKVAEDHTADLMAIPGVVGVAVSELENHTPCIWVMVKRQTAALEGKIPKVLEGYPVVIHVSGDIRPVDSTGEVR